MKRIVIKKKNPEKKKQEYLGSLFLVLYDCISFRKSYGTYSYLLLSLKICKI